MNLWLILLLDIIFFAVVLTVLVRSIKRNVIKLAREVRRLLNPDYPVTPKELFAQYRSEGKAAARPIVSHLLGLAWKTYPKVKALPELAIKVRLQFIVLVATLIIGFVSVPVLAIAAIVQSLS